MSPHSHGSFKEEDILHVQFVMLVKVFRCYLNLKALSRQNKHKLTTNAMVV